MTDVDPLALPTTKDRHTLGAGLSVKEWLQKPDKQVTRQELFDFIRLYEHRRREERKASRWFRRLWRWLNEPIVRPLDGAE